MLTEVCEYVGKFSAGWRRMKLKEVGTIIYLFCLFVIVYHVGCVDRFLAR